MKGIRNVCNFKDFLQLLKVTDEYTHTSHIKIVFIFRDFLTWTPSRQWIFKLANDFYLWRTMCWRDKDLFFLITSTYFPWNRENLKFLMYFKFKSCISLCFSELKKLSEESLTRQPEEVFDIICKLGEGSYGSVYKVRNVIL